MYYKFIYLIGKMAINRGLIKPFYLMIGVFFAIGINAQQNSSLVNKNPEFPNITTPNVASFNKFIDYPISLYQGTPDVSIPIYNLNDGQINLPIVLRYNTSGIKVSEEASWVGLGWNLNVGGVITQNVVGFFDQEDEGGYDQLLGNSFLGTDPVYFQYSGHTLLPLTRDLYDKLFCHFRGHFNCTKKWGKMNPDVFYFSYPGNSGKFMIDYFNGNKAYVLNREQDIKIDIFFNSTYTSYIDSFKITTPEGIIHSFKNPLKLTQASEVSSVAYTLAQTVYPNGQTVKYFYDQIDIESYSPSEVMKCPLENQYGKINSYYNETENALVGKEAILMSITTTNYQISFNSDTRLDLKNGKRLKNIIIGEKQGWFRQFIFEYSYFDTNENGSIIIPIGWNIRWPTGSDFAEKRLKLDAINTNYYGKTTNNRYEFTYNNTKLPRKDSYAVDYWGNYNSKTQNKSLIPDFNKLFYSVLENAEGNRPTESIFARKVSSGYIYKSADRTYDFNSCQAAILNGIKYPTGGFLELSFEPNTFSKLGARIAEVKIPETSPYSIRTDDEPEYYIPSAAEFLNNTEFVKAEDFNVGPPVNIDNFSVTENIRVSVLITIDKKGNWNTWNDIPTSQYEMAIMKKKTDGSYSYYWEDRTIPIIDANTQVQYKTVDVTLEPGDYYLKVDFPGEAYCHLKAEFSFLLKFVKPAQSTGCGLRIKSIKHYNSKGDAAPLLSTDYEYNNPGTSTSSGVLYNILNFINRQGVTYNYDRVYSNGNYIERTSFDGFLEMLEVSGNNTVSNPYGVNSGVGYTYVKEIKNGKNEAGYTLHKFHNHKTSFKQKGLILDIDVPSGNSYSVLNGRTQETTIYNASNGLLRKENYNYSAAQTKRFIGSNIFYNYNTDFELVKPHDEFSYENKYLYYEKVEDFGNVLTGLNGDICNAYLYQIYCHDILLTSKEVIFDGVLNKEDYIYNNALQLKNKTVNLNNNENLNYTYTYPNDYDCGIFNDMKTKNRLSEIIEQKVFKNGLLINSKLNQYSLINNLIVPSKTLYSEIAKPINDLTSFSCGGVNNSIYPQENVSFLNYDGYANINYLLYNGGNKIVYIWGYGGQYPVAEIKNATYDEVRTALGVAPESLSSAIVPDFTKIDGLRTKLPNALITTYTYRPWVGIKTQTDPNGITTFYEYDGFDRLKLIRDQRGDIIKTYDYHYTGQ